MPTNVEIFDDQISVTEIIDVVEVTIDNTGNNYTVSDTVVEVTVENPSQSYTTVIDNVNVETSELVVNVSTGDSASGTQITFASDQSSPTVSTEYLQATVGAEIYRIAAFPVAYPRFAISLSGAPNSSNVYQTQSNFSVTVNTVTGELTMVDSIISSRETGTVVDNSATFTGSMYQAEGTYTVEGTATGKSEDPEPVDQVSTVTSTWSRFIPAYWVVGGSAPTTLPSSSTGVMFGSRTVTGTLNQNIYLVTINSGFRFNVMGFEVNESLSGTILDQADTAGNNHSFNVYAMGKIGSSGSVSLDLV